MYKVRLECVVWMVHGAVCKNFAKDVELAIPPHKGLKIDMDFVEYVETDTVTGKTVCHMVAYETHGDPDDFNAECEKFKLDGWKRI